MAIALPPSQPEQPLESTERAASSVLFLALRRLRPPLLVMVLTYAVSVMGMALIPGATADGVPTSPMSVFHALYFVSYTATTIGFGEVPEAFTNAQRMWAVVVIHLSVIGWAYALANAIALLNDAAFRSALRQLRFRRAVRRLREPFYLICGAGDTGQRLAHLLDHLRMRFVVLDRDPRRIDELDLEDLHTDAPMLPVDLLHPQSLLLAGLRHPQCRGVLAVDPDDETNLAVVTAARLLNRALPVIAGAESPRTFAIMQAFGAYRVISPFDAFAENMMLAMRSPGSYRLVSWLTAPDDSELEGEHRPPTGHWVICGYGRFGRAVARRLLERGCRVAVIDPALPQTPVAATGASGVAAGRLDPEAQAMQGSAEAAGVLRIVGLGTVEAHLREAGVLEAAGIVAATDDDIRNMAVAALAHSLHPKLFTVLRQNDAANDPLFKAFKADLVMRPSEIIADECVAMLTAPLLERFLSIAREREDVWCDEAILRLRRRVGKRSPRAWAVRLDPQDAPAVHELLTRGTPVLLSHLLRDPGLHAEALEADAALLLREGHDMPMPKEDTSLRIDDRILFLGRGHARKRQALALFDSNVLRYLCTGRDVPGGWVLQKLFG